MRNPTPPESLTDARGRPYFLWDVDMTLDALAAGLRDEDRETRGYLLGKLMRQAKPDDVLTLVTPAQVARDLAIALPYLGDARDFWVWIVATWRRLGIVDEPA